MSNGLYRAYGKENWYIRYIDPEDKTIAMRQSKLRQIGSARNKAQICRARDAISEEIEALTNTFHAHEEHTDLWRRVQWTLLPCRMNGTLPEGWVWRYKQRPGVFQAVRTLTLGAGPEKMQLNQKRIVRTRR